MVGINPQDRLKFVLQLGKIALDPLFQYTSNIAAIFEVC
jgi:hypothetical protein